MGKFPSSERMSKVLFIFKGRQKMTTLEKMSTPDYWPFRRGMLLDQLLRRQRYGNSETPALPR